MPKLQKKRSSTPCLGICSTTFGDEVCKGCKRFAHEIVSWTKYSPEEREIINLRLEQFKIQILKRRFKIIDPDLWFQVHQNGQHFSLIYQSLFSNYLY